jgi:hypothetical protein
VDAANGREDGQRLVGVLHDARHLRQGQVLLKSDKM